MLGRKKKMLEGIEDESYVIDDLPEESNHRQGLIFYDEYDMSPSERIKYIAIAAIALFVLGYIFYRSIILAALLAVLSIFYPRIKRKAIIQNRKKMLSVQFKEGLYSLSAALSAGRSIESSFEEAVKDLYILYQSKETFIIQEFELIVNKVKLNQTIEEAIYDFAERSQNDDVKNFADVFITCKRTGGEIISVIKTTSDAISDKIQIEQEIETLIAEKKLEQRVMNLAPILLVAFLSYGAGDFMEPIFTTFIGRVVMTTALLLIGISVLVSKKIMNIEV